MAGLVPAIRIATGDVTDGRDKSRHDVRTERQQRVTGYGCWYYVPMTAGRESYLPIARSAIALSIAAFTADMLKLAAACIGGKSIMVCAAFATSC
jgi:hypothetical protein